MYNLYKNYIEDPEPYPKMEEQTSSFAKRNPLILLAGVIIVYGLLATILLAIAVDRYRSSRMFNFMETQLQIVSAEDWVLTMAYPNGELITAKILNAQQSIVYYQNKTFSVAPSAADSLEIQFIFSDGKLVTAPPIIVVTNPDAPLIPGLTERQQAEMDLLRALRRLYREFISTNTFILHTIGGLVLLFAGILIMVLSRLYFNKYKKPPPDWNKAYLIMHAHQAALALGFVFILLAFGMVTRM